MGYTRLIRLRLCVQVTISWWWRTTQLLTATPCETLPQRCAAHHWHAVEQCGDFCGFATPAAPQHPNTYLMSIQIALHGRAPGALAALQTLLPAARAPSLMQLPVPAHRWRLSPSAPPPLRRRAVPLARMRTSSWCASQGLTTVFYLQMPCSRLPARLHCPGVSLFVCQSPSHIFPTVAATVLHKLQCLLSLSHRAGTLFAEDHPPLISVLLFLSQIGTPALHGGIPPPGVDFARAVARAAAL